MQLFVRTWLVPTQHSAHLHLAPERTCGVGPHSNLSHLDSLLDVFFLFLDLSFHLPQFPPVGISNSLSHPLLQQGLPLDRKHTAPLRMCPHPLLTPVGHHYCLLRIILTHALTLGHYQCKHRSAHRKGKPKNMSVHSFQEIISMPIYQSFIMDVRLVCIHTGSFSHFLVRQQIGNTTVKFPKWQQITL